MSFACHTDSFFHVLGLKWSIVIKKDISTLGLQGQIPFIFMHIPDQPSPPSGFSSEDKPKLSNNKWRLFDFCEEMMRNLWGSKKRRCRSMQRLGCFSRRWILKHKSWRSARHLRPVWSRRRNWTTHEQHEIYTGWYPLSRAVLFFFTFYYKAWD